jgi:hypothetical protein
MIKTLKMSPVGHAVSTCPESAGDSLVDCGAQHFCATLILTCDPTKQARKSPNAFLGLQRSRVPQRPRFFQHIGRQEIRWDRRTHTEERQRPGVQP